MATYTRINGDFSILKTVLENSGFFDSVENGTFDITSANFTGLICGTEETQNFFKYGRHETYGYGYIVNQGSDATTAYRDGKSNDTFFPVAAYATTYGVSIICRRSRILITRNQSGKTVVAVGCNSTAASNLSSTVDAVMSSIYAVAETDDEPYGGYTLNTSIGFQTYIVPICTMSSILSYTDKAGLLAYKQNVAIGNTQYNNKRYLSDGYFAIEDPET